MLIYQIPRGKNKGWLHTIAPTMTSNDYPNNNLVVCDFPKSTNTQLRSINPTSQTTNSMETSQKSFQKISQTSTVSLDDFLANHSRLLESVSDSPTPEELSFLKSQGYSKRNSQDSAYWKMWSDSYLMMMGELSKSSSPRLQSWGMTCNGKCSTQRITESLRTGSECSLSDILEDHPDQKYFLSDKQMDQLMRDTTRAIPRSRVHSVHDTETEHEAISSSSIILDTPTIGSTEQTESAPHSTPCRGGGRQPFIQSSEPIGQLSEENGHLRVRRLTVVECCRLQGFPDKWCELVSNSQAYKCLGNAVTVNVIRDIFTNLIG